MIGWLSDEVKRKYYFLTHIYKMEKKSSTENAEIERFFYIFAN